MSPDPYVLLDWYDAQRRDLPWRFDPGEKADPYKVWLSEIMLQQTTVKTVKDYYRRFLERWPRLEDLADAELDDVLHAWQGLGYYARARNLHKCAQTVRRQHNSHFPETEKQLLELPGIGPYTAAAIAAIAFGQKATPVDGNVERVVSRLFKVETPLPASKKELEALARSLTPERRAGDFAQAMMDLGATLCSPKNPACGLCPFHKNCAAYLQADPALYPKKAAKKPKPTKTAYVFWLENTDGDVLMRKRPPKGLLGAMMEFPSTDWQEAPLSKQQAISKAPANCLWREMDGEIKHTFTHFHLVFKILKGKINSHRGVTGQWIAPDRFEDHALPTLMKKIAHKMARS